MLWSTPKQDHLKTPSQKPHEDLRKKNHHNLNGKEDESTKWTTGKPNQRTRTTRQNPKSEELENDNPKRIRKRNNRALITRWWRIVSDLGWNSSRTKMGMNPRTNGGKMEDVDLGVFGTGEIHATWRRFQDKWERSPTLNRRFKDKDGWFWGEPRDLRENSNFHITQI